MWSVQKIFFIKVFINNKARSKKIRIQKTCGLFFIRNCGNDFLKS